MPWAKRTSKRIPNISSPSTTYEINDYSRGMNRFVSNDKFPLKDGDSNMWRLAQNGRITTLGEYETRKGFDFHSAGAGETIDVQQTSTTGAGDQDFSNTARVAKKITFTTTGRCNRLDLNLKNSASATGVIMVELYSNSSGAPGTLLATSSLASSDLDTTYGYETVRFAEAPSVTATDYWAVIYTQEGGTGTYKISSTTNASTGLTSSDSGVTWSASSEDYNVKAYLTTTAGVKGLHRAYKSDGTKVTLFVHGTVLYSVDDNTGALTSVKTGLSSSATEYRFATVNDITYYVNGYDGLRKLSGASFGTDAQVSATNYTHITEHKGLLFLVTKDDPNKVVFSNFADYETYTSTDFIYVPSPKTGDPVTALASVNGYLIIFTRNSKYLLSGEDNATFRLDPAPDQNGTYTQETIAIDKTKVYHLAKDGVYWTNGMNGELMSENIYEDIRAMLTKESACMAINRGRLYLWYASAGSSYNDSCYVWNINFSGQVDSVESHDTDAYVKRAVSTFRDNDDMLVGSSLVGQVFWQEKSSNDYNNLGAPIEFILQTHYMTFGSPTSLKQIRYWNPRFGAQSADYDIDCQYATDLRDSWTTQSPVDVQGSGTEWGSGALWGAFDWGSTSEIQAQLYVPGEYRRIALRYYHNGAREPHTFLGHTLKAQIRRMR